MMYMIHVTGLNRKKRRIKMNKEEARLVWNLCNMMENQMLKNFKHSLKAFHAIYGDNSQEPVDEWISETVREFNMLRSIKAQMSEVIKDERNKI